MSKVECKFSEEFKSMWEPDSKVLLALETLEGLFAGLLEKCQFLAAKQRTYHSPKEIEQAMHNRSEPMEQLYVELANLLWNKFLLRTHLKVRDALQLLFHSANSANAYGCALSARAILEHVALLQHFWDKVPWRKSRIVPGDDIATFTSQMTNLVLGSRIDWQKLFSKSLKETLASGQWDRPQEERIPRMAEIIKSIDDALFSAGRLYVKKQMHFLYGILCDVVHPGWGGDFVYSTRMSFVVSPEPEFNSHFKLCAIMFCLPVVEFVKHLFEQAGAMAREELATLTRR